MTEISSLLRDDIYPWHLISHQRWWHLCKTSHLTSEMTSIQDISSHIRDDIYEILFMPDIISIHNISSHIRGDIYYISSHIRNIYTWHFIWNPCMTFHLSWEMTSIHDISSPMRYDICLWLLTSHKRWHLITSISEVIYI